MQRMMSVTTTAVVLLLGCGDSDGPLAPQETGAAVIASANLKAPSGLEAVLVSATAIALTWQDNSVNESGFEIHRSTTGATGAFTILATTGPNVRTWRDEELAPATTYCYRVRAFRRNGNSTSSSLFSTNTPCAVTPAPPPPPPPPPSPPAAASDLTAVPLPNEQAALTWIDNSSNEDGFRIDLSTDGGTVWTLYGTAGTTSANIPAVAEQQTCARIVAYNAGGEAAPSNTACTTPPAAPTDLIATRVEAATIALTWSDNSAVEDGYQVWLYQANCVGICNAFDPLCDLYGICPQSSMLAALPANSTGTTVSSTLFGTYAYEFLYVVATKDGGGNWAFMVPVP